jgi:hypothetical protein
MNQSASPASSSSSTDAGRANTRRRPPERELLEEFGFTSEGPYGYRIDVKRAKNGNPLLELTQTIPKRDGGTFDLTFNVWSEDFDSFFKSLGQAYRYIKANRIETPPNHKRPNRSGARPRGRAG